MLGYIFSITSPIDADIYRMPSKTTYLGEILLRAISVQHKQYVRGGGYKDSADERVRKLDNMTNTINYIFFVERNRLSILTNIIIKQ